MTADPAAAPLERTPTLRLAGGLLAYLAAYLALDWASLIEPVGVFGITPWNPPAGLTFALLLHFGPRVAPAAFAAVVLADLLFRGLSANPLAVVGSAAAIAGGYALAAAALRRRLGPELPLDRPADLMALLAVALVAPILIASTVVTIFALVGLLPPAEMPAIGLRFWVGDVIGIAVFTPFLLVYVLRPDRALAWPDRIAAMEYALQLFAIAFGLWVIFGVESADHFEFSYVLFLPLIWIALRDGLKGAIWGIVATQAGLALAMHLKTHESGVVLQFQLLMLAVTITGLFLGAAVDQRRRAERSLRDSQARLRTVIGASPDAILTFPAAGEARAANRAAATMFGLPVGGSAPLRALLPELEPAPQAMSGVEMTARRLDGEPLIVEVAVGEARGGEAPLFVAVVRDVGGRKEAEATAKLREAQLARAARMATTGEMAAALAHELNQPLTALIAFARAGQAALRKPDPASASSLIDRTVQQALRAGEIIRTTREFIGRGDMRPAKVEVERLFQESIALARVEASPRGVEIAARVEPDLPPAFVDAIQIEQVIVNLLRNAVEAIDSARPARRRIDLHARLAPDAPGFVEVSVRDTGPGVDPEIAARLFRPLATTKDDGMGLGLSISRTIVEAHGGRIWAAESPRGGGADIRFTAPLYSAGAHAD